ncbi:hypothetical protein QI30_19375 [Kurthia sp. 3B1D]|uniref:Uncharacterized protein n=1 Tax=Candidatus Kurthia intestinigallinarum TaxID=1562256 RepID=A0A433RNS3_9BACL|nr:hypothetical protein [Kurthia sp. 3B1D]RUS50227.1 hypothetical protein QI30_19375 [Kurthia sp. 3B1D]
MTNDIRLLSEEELKEYYLSELTIFESLVEELENVEVKRKIEKYIPAIQERCNSVTALRISKEIGYLDNSDYLKDKLYRKLKSLHFYKI